VNVIFSRKELILRTKIVDGFGCMNCASRYAVIRPERLIKAPLLHYVFGQPMRPARFPLQRLPTTLCHPREIRFLAEHPAGVRFFLRIFLRAISGRVRLLREETPVTRLNERSCHRRRLLGTD
jgi:hypothetical protein